MQKKVPLLALPLVILALAGFGCNPFQSAKDKLTQRAGDAIASGILSKAAGGEVNVNSQDGALTMKDNKTGATVAFGEDLKLPDDFPSDVFVYEGAKVSSVMSNGKDQTATITLTTTDDAQRVVRWYESKYQSAGWKEDTNTTMNTVELRAYSKDNAKIAFSVWPDDQQKSTFISLNKTVEKEDTSETEEEPAE